MTREATYQCVPLLIYAMCMPTEEVVYKSDMQGDEIHQSRTTRNPMQSAVILSVNSPQSWRAPRMASGRPSMTSMLPKAKRIGSQQAAWGGQPRI